MMVDREDSSNVSREVQGGALFFLSSFPLVLVTFALIKHFQGEAPSSDARNTALLARAIVDGVGYFPPLVLAGGFAGIGGWLVLGGREIDVGRHLSGFLGVSLGMAILLGSFSTVHGGSFGVNTGGALSSGLGVWAGALVGTSAVLVSVWLAWMQGRIEAKKAPGRAPLLSEALSEKDSDGVSPAEANALVPDDSTLAYMEEIWRRSTTLAVQPDPIPPSPYPDDVRQEGGIPDGTKPLVDPTHATLSSGPREADPASWQRTETDDRPDLAARVDLAPEADAPAAAVDTGAPGDSLSAAGPRSDRASSTPLEITPGGPPTPTWEQPPLFGEGESASTAATASPTSMGVEALDEDEPATEPVDATDAIDDSVAEEAEDELAEDEEYEYVYEDEEGEEEDEDEEEVAEGEDGESAEYEEEEEEDEEGEEEEEDPEAEYEEYEEGEEEEEDPEAEYEEYEEGEEEEEEEYEEEVAEQEPEPAAELPEPEPEVVLQPQPAPEPEAAKPPAGAELDREELIHACGKLFLDQGRVAVSLLQREFRLDFDTACEVLDELQEQGLIGPYMGGQRRDILLTLEEWNERATSP